MTPYLVPCLVKLRDQFNHEFPGRDKGADGWIADSAHSSTSDHQPNAQGAVRAIDIDVDVHRPGITLWQVCEMLRGYSRLEYIIHLGQISSRSQGWSWRPYTGSSDPHTNHAHFSARHDGYGWSSTAAWGLETLMTKSEFMGWMTEWANGAGRDALNGLALTDKIGDLANPDRTVGDVLRDAAKLRGVLIGDPGDTKNAALSPTSPLAQLLAVAVKPAP